MPEAVIAESEAEQAVGKALAGLGVPSGLAQEGGRIAALALSGGLDDGALIAAALDRLEAGAPVQPRLADPAGASLDAQGGSALPGGIAALDLAAGDAVAAGGRAQVTVAALGEPWLLAGAQCRLARRGYPSLAAWRDARGLTCLAARQDGADAGAWQLAELPPGLPEPGDDVVLLGLAATVAPPGPWPVPVDPAPVARLADWLAERRRRLATGIAVPAELWQRLDTLGKANLVDDRPNEG